MFYLTIAKSSNIYAGKTLYSHPQAPEKTDKRRYKPMHRRGQSGRVKFANLSNAFLNLYKIFCHIFCQFPTLTVRLSFSSHQNAFLTWYETDSISLSPHAKKSLSLKLVSVSKRGLSFFFFLCDFPMLIINMICSSEKVNVYLSAEKKSRFKNDSAVIF